MPVIFQMNNLGIATFDLPTRGNSSTCPDTTPNLCKGVIGKVRRNSGSRENTLFERQVV